MEDSILKYTVFAIAVLFVLPAGVVLGGWNSVASQKTLTNPATAVLPQYTYQRNAVSHVTRVPKNRYNDRVNALLNSLETEGTPTSDIYLPNFNPPVTMNDGHVQPLYPVAPAPMGIGDFGLKNQNGTIVGYNLTTSSIEGTMTVNNLSSSSMSSAQQTSGSIQLNTVLTNVTLFGVTNYTYWTQNVIVYSNNFHRIKFVLNIWNFSSSAGTFPKNGIAKGKGRVVGNEVYITQGPSFSVALPATVDLYTNASLINGDSAVFFNYTLMDAGVISSGTFDEVLFNSTGGMPPGYSAPAPHYLISGTVTTPPLLNAGTHTHMGFLYDAEIMIGGPGGGSTTTIYNINATMALKYYNTSSSGLVSVPSAFNFGTDTGETSTGANVWWNGTTAFLNEGPSLLYGMWNVSSSKPRGFGGRVSPSNAFMFVSGGSTFNASADAWNPLPLSGNYDFHVPYGEVSGQILLSYYRPVSFTISAGKNFNLRRNRHAGIYTPLYAFGNSQIAYIASGGNGSLSSAYMLSGVSSVASISPLFDELNDWLFPVFAGVFFWNVSAHVEMNGMPLLRVMYGTQTASADSLPAVYNYLNYEFYADSNISLWKSEVSGYFTNSFLPYGIILLDSSNMLVGGNRLHASAVDSFVGHRNGGSVAILGGTDNTVWGNTFESNMFTDLGSGLLVRSSGNLVYNNMFLQPVSFTAESPRIFSNTWNISKQPASAINYVNGYALTGSIIHGTYQGGNLWWNYNGTIPYNDGGLIGTGGDYVPLNLPPNTTIQVRQPTRIPDIAPINYTLVHDLKTVGSLTPNTTLYTTIQVPNESFQSIILTYNGQAYGTVYDVVEFLIVNNVLVWHSVQPENGNWTIVANLTEYESLFHGSVNLIWHSPNGAVNGSYYTNATLSFYPGSKPAGIPNMVVPLVTRASLTYGHPEVTVPVSVPSDTAAATLQVFQRGNTFDEFWYGDEPSYRAVTVYSGNKLIANVLPWYLVNTGGIDLFAWRPLPAPYDLSEVPTNVNVTAALGIIENSGNMEFNMTGVFPYAANWMVSANLLIYTNPAVTGAQPVSYFANMGKPRIVTNVPLPSGGTASVNSFFYENVINNFGFSSSIHTVTGTITVSKRTSEVSSMDQYVVGPVWENLTGYQLTQSRMVTVYNEQGMHDIFINAKTTYFPIEMQTGFVFTITQTTNGGFPMYGPFAQYLNNMSEAFDVSHFYTNVTANGITRTETSVSNSLYTSGDLFAGVIELTSPVAGIISSITAIKGTTLKTYTSLVYGSQDGRLVLESGYQHVLEAVSNNPPGPDYFGTITVDFVYTF